MILWVLYDIADDRARTRVARHCKRAGLYRVQYSVFVGSINTDDRDALRLDIEDEIEVETDKVYIFTLSRNELHRSILLGQAFDKKFITDEIRDLLL